jgi:hypothetical protein
MKKNSCIWSGDKDDRFVLDQHTLLEFYNSARALKQQSADWHIATLGQIILIQSQSVFPLSPICCMLRNKKKYIDFGLTGLWLEPTNLPHSRRTH